eukprot:1621127-Prymnesium_polylepis.1
MALRAWAAATASNAAHVEALHSSAMAMYQRTLRSCFSRLREAGRAWAEALRAVKSLVRLSEGRALRQWVEVARLRSSTSAA